jgi:hypothetical protein
MFCPKIDTALTGNVYIHNGTSQEVVVKGNFFPEVRVNIINIYKCLTSTVLIHAKTNFNKIDHCSMKSQTSKHRIQWNINKVNNHLLPEIIEQIKDHKIFGLQSRNWCIHVAGLNHLMGSKPTPLFNNWISNSNTDVTKQ